MIIKQKEKVNNDAGPETRKSPVSYLWSGGRVCEPGEGQGGIVDLVTLHESLIKRRKIFKMKN